MLVEDVGDEEDVTEHADRCGQGEARQGSWGAAHETAAGTRER